MDTQGFEPYLPLCKRGAFPVKLTAQSVVESIILPHFRCVLSLHLDMWDAAPRLGVLPSNFHLSAQISRFISDHLSQSKDTSNMV